MPFPLAYHRCYGKKSHKKDCSLVFSQDSLLRLTHLLILGVTGKPYLSCLSCHSHPIRPCGTPSPLGEGCDTRIPSSKKAAHHPCEPIRSPSTVIPSAAEGSLLHCRHMHTCTPHLNDTLVLPFSPFPRSRFTALQEGSLYFGPHDTQERRIVSYRFSYRCVELCLFEALYPAPAARAVWPHRKAP